MKRQIALACALIAALIVAGVFVSTSIAPPRVRQTTVSPTLRAPTGAVPTGAALLTFTSFGFSPTNITTSPGATITVVNATPNPIQIDSNPYPNNTDNPELNIGQVGPGMSKSAIVKRHGAWKVHNQLAPSMEASITVQ